MVKMRRKSSISSVDRPIDDEDSTAVGYIDALFVLGWTFILVLALVLAFLNPPTTITQVQRPDHVRVEISWNPGPTDIDLWVRGPGDVAVGYSNHGARVFNLLRDDLGFPDPEANWEISLSRGLLPGPYIINLHYFSSLLVQPVEVAVEVTVFREGHSTTLLAGKKVLTRPGEELTVWSFGLFEDGTLVPGSVSETFVPLRGFGQ